MNTFGTDPLHVHIVRSFSKSQFCHKLYLEKLRKILTNRKSRIGLINVEGVEHKSVPKQLVIRICFHEL